jgi:PAS domain-containing protein
VPTIFVIDDDGLQAVVAMQAEVQHEPNTEQEMKQKLNLTYKQSLTQQGFDLDYEEVFVNSNIPQLLATTDGRILAWNNFFLRATGLNEETIKKATIFGLVRCSKLANLFEIVAKALRNKSQPVGNYLATTLPCVKFRACEPRQLYITVSTS